MFLRCESLSRYAAGRERLVLNQTGGCGAGPGSYRADISSAATLRPRSAAHQLGIPTFADIPSCVTIKAVASALFPSTLLPLLHFL